MPELQKKTDERVVPPLAHALVVASERERADAERKRDETIKLALAGMGLDLVNEQWTYDLGRGVAVKRDI